MPRLPQLALKVKRLIDAWERDGARAAVEAARRCRCGHPFRHRHGGYRRFVVVGDRCFQLAIPRLLCPACRVTAAVLPAFLPRHSPYPFCLRQAAIWAYLTESIGYRQIAARLELSWQLPWAWVDSLANRAKETLALVEALLLRYEPCSEPIRRPPQQGRSRSVEKDERLAAAAVLFVQAFKLWHTGYRHGRPWGRPSWMQMLAFVQSCASTLG